VINTLEFKIKRLIKYIEHNYPDEDFITIKVSILKDLLLDD